MIEAFITQWFRTRPEILSDSEISPLTLPEFIHHVVVMEVAIVLIREDMSEGGVRVTRRTDALTILQQSREYGRTRFDIGSQWTSQ